MKRPKCPAWLDKAAKSRWRALVPELERLGLLTIIDGDALAAYCQAWAEFEIATRTLQAEGRTFRTESGYLAPHPAVAQQRSAWNAVKTFAALFGLDPADRSQLNVPTPTGRVIARDRSATGDKSRFFAPAQGERDAELEQLLNSPPN